LRRTKSRKAELTKWNTNKKRIAQNAKLTEIKTKIRNKVGSPRKRNIKLSKIKSSKGFTSSSKRNDKTLGKRISKQRNKLESNFEATYKRKQTTLLALDFKDDDSILDPNPLMEYHWENILKRFGISTNAKDDKPIKAKIKRTECPAKINEERKKTYLQIIGSIIFEYTHCRLDVAFAVGMLTRVMHNPSEGHLKHLFGLLRYINAANMWGLKFFRDTTMRYGMDFTFFAYCDSSHADDEDSNSVWNT
jgi:hypothetical protein